MGMFPPIGLLNRFYLGDTVLLEGPADTMACELGTDVFVVSEYPELFEHHPRVRGISSSDPQIGALRVIDMTDSIRSMEDITVRGKARKKLLPGKLARMWEQAGFSEDHIRASRLYLSPEEQVRAGVLCSVHPGSRIGVVLRSRHDIKTWPYTRWLIKQLRRDGYEVFAITDVLQSGDEYLSRYGVCQVIGKPLRELMVYLSAMDLVVGPDTGPMHMAAALGIDTVVMTRDFWKDIVEVYDNCSVVTTRFMRKYGMYSIRPSAVLQVTKERLAPDTKRVLPRKTQLALFRLDGLGGTLTLADQAKKIHEKTGIKSVLVIRGYGAAFAGNPYIEDVIEVGHVKWHECLEEMLTRFDTLAEIRFAPGKWYQKKEKVFEQDFGPIEGIFDAFPMRLNEWEIHGLHQVQITDQTLGLPYDTIDMEIFAWGDVPFGLPKDYIVLNNGVDTQHQGMRQTKTWNDWAKLVSLVDMPFVQAGTLHDPPIAGAIDLRGKTDLAGYFTLLKEAAGVVATEGGAMHCAYAVGAKNTIIVRGPTRGKLFEYPRQVCVDSHICYNCVGSTDDWYMNCPKGIDAICMKSITAERVAFNLEGALDENMA